MQRPKQGLKFRAAMMRRMRMQPLKQMKSRACTRSLPPGRVPNGWQTGVRAMMNSPFLQKFCLSDLCMCSLINQ